MLKNRDKIIIICVRINQLQELCVAKTKLAATSPLSELNTYPSGCIQSPQTKQRSSYNFGLFWTWKE